MLRRVFITLVLMAGLAGVASAEDRSSLLPQMPKATGEPHPEGNEFWRQRHMDLMRHDRNLTMREGDRQIDASLKQCFDCHAATDNAGQVVTYESEKHFCRTCHDYVAVKVDCFMCHRSTPDGVDEGAAHASAAMPVPTPDISAVRAYLSGLATVRSGARPLSLSHAAEVNE